MGSLAPGAVLDRDRKDEYHVLVTGFGPFLDNAVNPSNLIASALPSTHILTTKSTKISSPEPLATRTILIHIHTPHSPLEVSYAYIDKHIPEYLVTSDPASLDHTSPPPPPPSSNPQTEKEPATAIYDLTLNLGLAPGRTAYSLETRAKRDGYTQKDIYGQTPASLPLPAVPWRGTSSSREDAPQGLLPPGVLEPTFDMPRVFGRWMEGVRRFEEEEENRGSGKEWWRQRPRPSGRAGTDEGDKEEEESKDTVNREDGENAGGIKLHLSQDAGTYLCEYTFYACLKQYWLLDQRERRRKGGISGGGNGDNEDGNEDENDERRPSFFMHVPSGSTAPDVRRGVGVVLALLEAVVECDRGAAKESAGSK